MTEIEGILISCSLYKENDAILNVLTKDGYVSILGRGLFKVDNKNHSLLNGFVIGKFDCYKGKVGGLKLRSYEAKNNLTLDYFDYESIVILDCLKELLFKIKENDDSLSLYNELYRFLTYSNKETRLKDFLYFLFNLLIILGIKPLIEDKFNYFDIDNGKFVYIPDPNTELELLSEEKIEAIINLENGQLLRLNNKEIKELIVMILSFIDRQFSIALNCIDLFK